MRAYAARLAPAHPHQRKYQHQNCLDEIQADSDGRRDERHYHGDGIHTDPDPALLGDPLQRFIRVSSATSDGSWAM